jgi:serine/threonine-protein kinase
VARGGAGTIYEACDDALGRRVALKVYHRGQEGPDQIRREARTCVALAGPGVVRLYEADFDQGWIALEWLALGSARELLESRRLDVLADVARWAEPLAGALARVHAAGLVHADVKPGNVLFREPGVPLLNDFGISAPAGRGSLGGSRGYLSPERLAGEPLAPDDDVYGFGRLLEDVLQVVPDAPSAGALRDLSDQCMRPRAHRPPDGAAVRAILAGSSLLLAGG